MSLGHFCTNGRRGDPYSSSLLAPGKYPRLNIPPKNISNDTRTPNNRLGNEDGNEGDHCSKLLELVERSLPDLLGLTDDVITAEFQKLCPTSSRSYLNFCSFPFLLLSLSRVNAATYHDPLLFKNGLITAGEVQRNYERVTNDVWVNAS
ncbi:hypothetical protein CC2G_009813 [Coprinopsis cinerea AmutBmut pab1-1]|nr:hypothetical protein CC2G_009813 [Coprinopsis cinerea AmutBmut pab1-1]